MTFEKKPLCDACRDTAGWIEDVEGNIVGRCPCRMSGPSPKDTAMRQAVAAHPGAFEAALRIVADAADTREFVSANEVRPEMDAAGVDTPVIGAAFARAVKLGWIELARLLPSTDPGTHGKRVGLYASKRFGRGAA